MTKPAKKIKPTKKAVKKSAKKTILKTPRILFEVAHASRTISASRIYELFVDVLGKTIKDIDDPPSNYGITNVAAYADFLNHTPQFSPYHLDLQQADVVNVQNMGDLGAAIITNFEGNGWTVTDN